jgi:hypothetical protein
VICYFVVILGLGCYCEHTKGTEKKSKEKRAKKNFKNRVVGAINPPVGWVPFALVK